MEPRLASVGGAIWLLATRVSRRSENRRHLARGRAQIDIRDHLICCGDAVTGFAFDTTVAEWQAPIEAAVAVSDTVLLFCSPVMQTNCRLQ